MCVVSMVGDHYTDKWVDHRTVVIPSMWQPNVSREEFEALKRDVDEMKALLKRAKEYDLRNGEPDCEMDDKIALLKKVAEMVGVSLDDVFD